MWFLECVEKSVFMFGKTYMLYSGSAMLSTATALKQRRISNNTFVDILLLNQT